MIDIEKCHEIICAMRDNGYKGKMNDIYRALVYLSISSSYSVRASILFQQGITTNQVIDVEKNNSLVYDTFIDFGFRPHNFKNIKRNGKLFHCMKRNDFEMYFNYDRDGRIYEWYPRMHYFSTQLHETVSLHHVNGGKYTITNTQTEDYS